jgi:hypothetical protein
MASPQRPLVKYEICDRTAMEWVVNHFDALHPDLKPPDAQNLFDMCKAYLRDAKGKSLQVQYLPARGKPAHVGRLYAAHGLGMQALEKEVRHTIARDLYHDVDMVNAQPTILVQFCEKHGIPCPSLTDYVQNRDIRLGELMEGRGVPRNEAKKLVLKCLFYPIKNRDYPSWFVTLNKEMLSTREQVAFIHPEMFKFANKSKDNELGSLCSLVLQTIERKCLLALTEFLETRGFRVDVLIHDGCMVQRGPQDLSQDILIEAAAHVRKTQGYHMEIITKPMDRGLRHDADINEPCRANPRGTTKPGEPLLLREIHGTVPSVAPAPGGTGQNGGWQNHGHESLHQKDQSTNGFGSSPSASVLTVNIRSAVGSATFTQTLQ